MATIAINTNDYNSYASVAEADNFLAADVARHAAWAALPDDEAKGRALVTASRYLASLDWVGDTPDYDTPPSAVIQATSLFAADIAVNPDLGSDSSTGSNVKSVKGGSASVTFFRPEAGAVLPSWLLRLLGPLLGTDVTWGEGGTAYGSENDRVSRFDRTDFRLSSEYL